MIAAGVLTLTVAFLAVMHMVMPHHRRTTPRVTWRAVTREPASACERFAWFGRVCNRPLTTATVSDCWWAAASAWGWS